ncbi:ribosomal RNA methyltransferase [Cantharellus anzutake]|uniref:ribosomal RNA methyltransferase n=1 Tax=Cantharellus anzutake TaxID=1750568 RepID=UPI001908C82A|nr:ribosomal RNA methyltransferase [Cantharellus anzutake]KAF8332778.1 ribosomal RNA methyltransferase [Cantharellus anzutake]
MIPFQCRFHVPISLCLAHRHASTSSKIWLHRQSRDAFVKLRSTEGLRSRSAYKLLEIDQKYKVFRGANVVVDLGAAPGGWSEVAVKRINQVKPNGTGQSRVIAVDVLPIDPIPGVESIQGNFLIPETHKLLISSLGGSSVDVVISDMCANITGNRDRDSENSLDLCRAAFGFAKMHIPGVIRPQEGGNSTNGKGGILVMKYFDHPVMREFEQELKRAFRRVNIFKPKSSRSESGERYFVCIGHNERTSSSHQRNIL